MKVGIDVMTEHPAGADLIVIDWGTTNRRVYVLNSRGGVLLSEEDERGVLAMSGGDYAAELEAFRARFGPLPVIAAGMVGSTRGWREAPYVAAPAALADLVDARLTIGDADATIVPGVALNAGRCDVMRGEEIQVFGALSARLVPHDAMVCQPGTHNKWVRLERGRIVDFTTAMTGEIFAHLRAHGTLAGLLDGPVMDGEAFQDGLARGIGAVDLLAALFQVRAEVVLSRRSSADAAALVSGILIGADVGARGLGRGDVVHVLANGALAELYAVAVRACGADAVAVDGRNAFLSGVHAFWEMMR